MRTDRGGGETPEAAGGLSQVEGLSREPVDGAALILKGFSMGRPSPPAGWLGRAAERSTYLSLSQAGAEKKSRFSMYGRCSQEP